jgi:uncharacterized protein YjiS (DUF1127 family)
MRDGNFNDYDPGALRPMAVQRTMRDLEAWSARAGAANGFGDAVLPRDDARANGVSVVRGDTRTPAARTVDSHEVWKQVRAQRARHLGDAVRRLVRAAARLLRDWRARRRQQREANATYYALLRLDDRSLADLGLSRPQLHWIVADRVSHQRADLEHVA